MVAGRRDCDFRVEALRFALTFEGLQVFLQNVGEIELFGMTSQWLESR